MLLSTSHFPSRPNTVQKLVFLVLLVLATTDAALAASIFHDSIQGLGELKHYLSEQNIAVRETA